MDERLIALIKGAQGAMGREIQNNPTTQPQPQAQAYTSDGEKPMPMYNNVDGTQLLEHVPTTQGGQQVAQPMGAAGPNEYALRPVTNTNPIQHTYKNLHTSKMSPEILKAMVDNPIIQTAPKINAAGMRTFDLSDIPSDMIKGGQQLQQPNIPQVNESIQNPQVNQFGQKTITITEAELDAKIKNALFEFMSTTFTKTLTEATIKKTMGMLVKEGKLKITQKKKA